MIALLALCAYATAGPNVDYAWPLDLPRIITSSFGEYRMGRAHTGIDLRTGGIGLPVHAPRDGYVARVRCSPYGYGKALYLRLDDGNVMVFGHLDRFADPIAAYVNAEQHARQAYEVDLTPDAGRFPVHRGEIVAYSGQSGIGPAHLHAEPRDSKERPFNPRRLGWTWPDREVPKIRRILVMPDGPDATVNGVPFPALLEVNTQGDGTPTVEVSASGRVAFGLDVIDPANNGENVLGVYTARVHVGKQALFEVRNDRVDYATVGDGAVCYHPFLLDQGRFLLLWRWPGNRSESITANHGDGWLTVNTRAVDAEFEAVDFFGNRAAARLRLRPEKVASSPEIPESAALPGRVEWACYGDWMSVTTRFEGPEAETPMLEVTSAPLESASAFTRVDAQTFRTAFRPASAVREVRLAVRHPRLADTAQTWTVVRNGDKDGEVRAGKVSVQIPNAAAYGALFASIEELQPPAEVPGRVHGGMWRIAPTATPLAAPIRVRIPIPTDTEPNRPVHLYRRNGARWTFLETTRADGFLEAESRAFGEFIVLEDSQPPHLEWMDAGDGSQTDARRPSLRVKVSDAASGIADVTARVDGRWLLTEYDPEEGTAWWARDEDLPANARVIAFEVTDHAGNTARSERKLSAAIAQ